MKILNFGAENLAYEEVVELKDKKFVAVYWNDKKNCWVRMINRINNEEIIYALTITIHDTCKESLEC